MMLKSLKMIIAAVMLSTCSFANAGLITVEFNVLDAGTVTNGFFSGEDLDFNGLLTSDELTAIYNGGYNGDYNLPDLYDFGDFNIATVTWFPNAESFIAFPPLAFMTFGGIDSPEWSCTIFLGCSVEITSFVETDGGNNPQIPEPSTLAIFALGILGLGLRKSKK